MAKKNTKIVKHAPIEVINKGWYDIDLPGGKKGIGISPEFKQQIIQVAGGIGSLIRTFEEKQAELTGFALNLNEAFSRYKAATKNGLPAFVRDLVDPTCPGSYGKVGSTERDTINKHSIFRGVDALIKRANKAKQIEATRQTLIAAGLNPDDAEKVSEHNKGRKEQETKAYETAFVNVLIAFAQRNVTESTITKLLIFLGKAEKNGKDLSATGTKLLTAATTALVKKGLLEQIEKEEEEKVS